jgi:resuscitation-promoting factor RpfB
MQKNKLIQLVSILLVLIGAVLMWFGTVRPITVVLDGQVTKVWTRGFWVSWILKDAGISVDMTDMVYPKLNSLVGWNSYIVIEKSKPTVIYTEAEGVVNKFHSSGGIVGNLLADADIRVFPGDLIRWDGLVISENFSLPRSSRYSLFYYPSKKVRISSENYSNDYYVKRFSTGEFLWKLGEQLLQADYLSSPYESILEEDSEIKFMKAREIYVNVGNDQAVGMSSSQTIDHGMIDSGLVLEGLDYSFPEENDVLPLDGRMEIIHIDEAVEISQSLIPYKTEYVADPETELDQRSTVTQGKYGVQVNRKRIKFENGKEIDSLIDAQWIASEPTEQQLGYGTKVVIRTLDTPSGPVEYWRALNVYATAYSPCGLGNVAKCYYGTSLGVPVQRGVVAVIYSWYLLMAGQPVYVPGYGKAIIADVGGGIPGKDWIDLGFTDAELEEWHQYVTIYFLTPVPADIPWILP